MLGAGFTGMRVVDLCRRSGVPVVWTNTTGVGGAQRFDISGDNAGVLHSYIREDTAILHSIPTLKTERGLSECTGRLTELLKQCSARRVVYLSTTGVYGTARAVDETTAVQPLTERERMRANAENEVSNGPWSSIVLRPAAIYGPGRGIHAAMQKGEFRLPPNPTNYVSRIHVNDLATHSFAALLSDLGGAYPVADDQPCTSLEAAQFCATLLGVPLPQAAPLAELGETRRADRRVDGSRIRALLGIQLMYPSYRVGFPACLAEEMRDRSIS